MIEIEIVKVANGKRYRLTSFSVPESTFEQKAVPALDSVPESKPGAGTETPAKSRPHKKTKQQTAVQMLMEGSTWNKIIRMGISKATVARAAKALKEL